MPETGSLWRDLSQEWQNLSYFNKITIWGKCKRRGSLEMGLMWDGVMKCVQILYISED